MTIYLMTIRQNNEEIGHIGYDENGNIVTEGIIGENTYENFVEFIKGLQGFNIKIDEFYF